MTARKRARGAVFGAAAMLALVCCMGAENFYLPRLSDLVRLTDGDRVTLKVATVADLANLVVGRTLRDEMLVEIADYATAGGGGGGLYRYDAGSSATVDSGFVHNGPGSAGRFLAVDQSRATAKQFGCRGDGSTNDHTRLAAFLGCGAQTLVMEPGNYNRTTTSTLTLSAAGTTLIANGATMTVPEDWVDDECFVVTGAGCEVSGLAVTETNASATNADKSGEASNIGILVNASDVTLEDCTVTGFTHAVVVAGSSGAGAENNVTLRRVAASKAYNWGINVDSSKNCHIYDAVVFDNGWDGIKVQNENSVTCDGLYISGGHVYNNGLGAHGGGVNLYHGGYRFTLVGVNSHDNAGSGFIMKGGGTDPIQGEGSVVGCHFTGAGTISAAGQHGVEFIEGGLGASLIHFIGCNMSGNDGYGIVVHGPYGITFQGCNVNQNLVGGTQVVGCDNKFIGCNFFANTGIGIALGSSNAGTPYAHTRRTLIDGCTISGNYDPDLAGTFIDQRTASTSKLTTIGILAYVEAEDADIRNTSVYNCTDNFGPVQIWTRNCTLDGLHIYAGKEVGIGVYNNHTGNKVINCVVEDTDFSGGAAKGAIYIQCPGTLVRGNILKQSSSTANTEGIHFSTNSSGSVLGSNEIDADLPNPVAVLTGVTIEYENMLGPYEVTAPGAASTTGDGKVKIRVPAELNGAILLGVVVGTATPGTTGTTNVDLDRVRAGSAVDMLSTNCTVDSAEYDSTTAATPAVINTSNDDVQTGDVIHVNIDGVNSGTPAQDVSVTLYFLAA